MVSPRDKPNVIKTPTVARMFGRVISVMYGRGALVAIPHPIPDMVLPRKLFNNIKWACRV